MPLERAVDTAPRPCRRSDPPNPGRCRSRTWVPFVAVIAVLAIVSAFLPPQRATLLVPAGGLIALAALARSVLAATRGREADLARHPFVLVSAGLVLTVLSELLAGPERSDGLVDSVALAAYPFLVAGLVALHGSRVREDAVDTLLVAAIVPSALFAFGWFPLVETVDAWTPGTGTGSWGSWLLLGVDALAVAIVARLAVMFRGRPIAYQMLLGAMACLLGAHVARAIGQATGFAPAPFGTQTLLLGCFALMAGAALHPSLRRYEGTRPRAVSIGWPHLTLLIATVLVGPLFVVLRYGDQGTWVWLVAVGPAAVALLVVAHLARLIRERQRLEYMSSHDALTGLPNRTSFHERLALALARSSGVSGPSVMFIDLDRFKHVNDTLGHEAGDELLREVSLRLRSSVRSDDTVARLAGDEFAVLLVEPTDSARADDVSQRILSLFTEPFHVGGVALTVSPSVGIALAPQHGRDVETLLRNADSAMYAAKAGGRNTARTFSSGMASAAERHLVLEQRLRRSVVDGELVVHYQPRVDARTNRVLGVEALVRWQHPTLGLVPPGAFVSIAESTGFIAELGAWVLERACRDAAGWARAGHPLHVSVNVSPRQFAVQDVPALVRAALAGSGLPPAFLELELTESLHLNDDGSVAAALQDITALGVKCAVDDFGTGYSSIAALRDYPIGVVKLDRSFVQPVGAVGDAPLVRGVVQLAKGLGMRVVAEGVETEAQLDFLRGLMCDEVQGFLVSRAVPAEMILDLVRSAGLDGAVPPLAPVLLDVDERRLIELLWNERDVDAEEDDENAVRLAAVLSTAAGVMAVPVVLGIGAGGGLPPQAQHHLAATLQTLGAEAPQPDLALLSAVADVETLVSDTAAGGRVLAVPALSSPVPAVIEAAGTVPPQRLAAVTPMSIIAVAVPPPRQAAPVVGDTDDVVSQVAPMPAPVAAPPPAARPVSPPRAPRNPSAVPAPVVPDVPPEAADPADQPPVETDPPVVEPPAGEEPADPPGKPADPPGKPADPPGKPADPPGKAVGKPADPPGKPADPPGKPADPPGKPADPPGKPADPPGKAVGKPADPPGKAVGRPADPPGEAVGRPADPPGMAGDAAD